MWRHASPGGTDVGVFTSIMDVAGAAATAAAAWLASNRCSDARTSSAWRLIAVAFLCPTIGLAVGAIYVIMGTELVSPSVIDLSWFSYYPLMLIGLLRFPMRTQSRFSKRRMRIDTITITIGTLSVVWYFVLGPTLAQEGASVLVLLAAGVYPIGDVILVFGVVYALTNVLAPATRFALGFFGAAILVQVVCDVAYGWSVTGGQATLGSVVLDLYLAAIALYVIGAASQRPVSAEELRERPAETIDASPQAGRLGRWLPFAIPALVFALLIGAQFGAETYLRVGLAVGAAAVTGLVLLRQFVAQNELVDAQGELSFLAMHDVLTGLPNRALVLDRAAQSLARARRQHAPIAALFVDIDGFKNVNDTFGHAAGDELLQCIAARLKGLVRESDTVGRIGGDEFVLLLDSLNFDVAPELVAERVIEVVREPMQLSAAGNRTVTVTASIGVATSVGESADDLLRDADMAMYMAKTKGKNCTVVFESSMHTAAHDRLLLEMDLRAAIAENQFFLLYQPTFDLRTETVTGVEALIRWEHPVHGIVPPDRFIPLAEQTGMIIEIGDWVLSEACAQGAKWHAEGHEIGIAVNVSARQLDDDQEIVQHVKAALDESGLAASALTLEITETALMSDPDRASARLQTLKELGVRIAIDDFGTGYSSMAYLRQFPVDALKIDRSFISGAAHTPASAAILRSLVQLGKTLELETLGEGIEETTQLRNLQHEQCDSGQGFLFARPLAAEKLGEFLRDVTSPKTPAGSDV
ncbi:MAG TPA: EAL domain-containing protein [Baekduia sp.]|nr:EAL domain-containing protein [Baekduia sp.]